MTANSCHLPPEVLEAALGTDVKEEKQIKSANELPPEKVEAMQKMARQLKTKHPHMKTERIMRKVAEKFKIKLV